MESFLWMLLGRRALLPLQAHSSACPPVKEEEHSGCRSRPALGLRMLTFNMSVSL